MNVFGRARTYLGQISRRIELNSSRGCVKLISVEVKELHENFTQMVLRNHSSALNLRHILE